MHPLITRRAPFAALAVALAAGLGVGCAKNDPPIGPKPAGAAPEARTGKAMVKEAETMKGHGQQLQSQGDVTGGQQLIEQSKVKAAQGEQLIEKAATTQPAR